LGEKLSRDASKRSAIEKNGAGRGKKSGAKSKVPVSTGEFGGDPKARFGRITSK